MPLLTAPAFLVRDDAVVSVGGSYPPSPRFESGSRYQNLFRGVAQLGRVLALGARCRRFESYHPDHIGDNIGRVSHINRTNQK